MAATDQVYRSQKTLDIVFAVSSVLMLVSIIAMFVQDYNRPWKPEQRMFRQVESAISMHEAIESIPNPKDVLAALNKVRHEQKKRGENIEVSYIEDGQVKKKELKRSERIDELKREIDKLLPDKEAKEVRANDVKSFYVSATSLYFIAVEKYGIDHPEAQALKKKLDTYTKELAEAQKAADDVLERVKKYKRDRDSLEKGLIDAQTDLKKATDDLVRKIKTAQKKQWGFGDWFRSLPIIDGFASPTKLHQFTLHDLTIDYNFKGVTRFDRCMTCHQGIDRPGFTRERLLALRDTPQDVSKKLDDIKKVLEDLKDVFKGTPEADNIPDPASIKITNLSERDLTDARVTEFCAHPRLDLFVGPNSKHPAEKFGCTSCHSGQPSGTEFLWASHTPNDHKTKDEWKKKHGWESVHFWDFHMHPKRFIESSCLKCHHQVTDLITTQNKNEAPKLVRGYNLIKEFGCFGCHEIHGQKDGRAIGPDLRLEPSPPLEALPAGLRARLLADKENPPGTMLKVGPSLYRLDEKTNERWTARWLLAPRDFRPDTKMPHFYGLSNNDPSVLPDKQKKFPSAEIYAVTHVLFKSSRDFLGDVKTAHDELRAKRQELEALRQKGKNLTEKEAAELTRLQREVDDLPSLVAQLQDKTKLTPQEKAELDQSVPILKLRDTPAPLSDAELPKTYRADPYEGRNLFTERGCLACHTHQGTTKEHRVKVKEKDEEIERYLPAVVGESQFGPNLSQVSEKLIEKKGDVTRARRWLIHWLKNPQAHSPRSRMPITHLTNEEAAQIADWLLSQEPRDLGKDWKDRQVTKPDLETLRELAKVYLVDKVLSQHETEELLNGKLPKYRRDELPQEEKDLAKRLADKEAGTADQHLTWYVGRKGINRLGCYACHDIPGFEQAKPIGTPLNEWGKKDAERLAFENIAQFIKDKYHQVDSLVDEQGKPVAGENGKPPYERYFAEVFLQHHGRTREAYLYQKIRDPRSYDYTRDRPYDDLARMPLFKFARIKQGPKESDADFLARAEKEEADAREAVMTFVLGLVAEPIPLSYLPSPSSERAAEIKGRQILDKFNCAGCHVTRPGTYEFKLTAKGLAKLEGRLKDFVGDYPKDHIHPHHNAWMGTAPSGAGKVGTAMTAVGTRSSVKTSPKEKTLSVWLVQDLRYYTAKGEAHDLRGGIRIELPVDDLSYPPREALASTQTLRAFEKAHAVDSGAFAYLLANYVVEKKRKNPDDEVDEGNGLVFAPPLLVRQGERTQPGWLYQFLRNPQQVRMATLLRMPKFNLSEEEAQALVNYFTAVDRMTNPGIGLTHPYVNIPHRDDLDSPFWRVKTAAYVAELKRVRDAEFKDPKDPQKTRTLYDRRVAELQGFWSKSDNPDAMKKEWEEKQAYVLDGLGTVKNVCLGCHQLGARKMKPGAQDVPGPSLDLSADRLRPEWTEQWLGNPQRFLPYVTIMSPNFPNLSGYHGEKFAAQQDRERVTGIRDFLMIYPRVADQPIMRYWLLTDDPGEKK